MAKPKDTVETKIDRLAKVVGRGFATMENGFTAVADDISEMKGDISEMKGHLAEVKTRLTSIESELRDIKGRLDLLEESVAGMKGFAVEIDELRARIKDIERILHIRRKITA